MYYVYLFQCKDNTFYCGYTNDITKRVEVHNSGKYAKYTRSRLPVELVYSGNFENKISAMKREYVIKQLTKEQKRCLLQ